MIKIYKNKIINRSRISNLLLLIGLLIFSCSNQLRLDKLNQNRSIHTIEETYYKAIKRSKKIIKGNSISVDDISSIKKEYNNQGQIIQKHTLLESKDTSSQKELHYITTYKYDEEGNMVERNKATNGVIVETDIFQYYDQGRQTSKCFSVYEDFLEGDIRCLSVEDCLFNEMKQKTKCTFFYSKPSDSLFVETYAYDTIGQLVAITTEYFELNYVSKKIEYDKQGNKVKTVILNKNGHRVSEINYKYNKLNLLTEEVYFNNSAKNKSTKKHQFFYDRSGNCIREIEYINEKPTKITERKIGYF